VVSSGRVTFLASHRRSIIGDEISGQDDDIGLLVLRARTPQVDATIFFVHVTPPQPLQCPRAPPYEITEAGEVLEILRKMRSAAAW
jgi:hypothetical protein